MGCSCLLREIRLAETGAGDEVSAVEAHRDMHAPSGMAPGSA